MKKVLAIILVLIMAASLITVDAAASSLEAVITGIRTEKEATFIVNAANNGEEKADFKVYVGTYDAFGALKSAKTYEETIEKGDKEAFYYKADLTLGEARIFVWESGIKPLAPSLTSGECENADLGEEVKIPFTASDAFASVTYQAENPAANVCDGSLDTRWTVRGTSEENPENVTVYLGGDYILSRVGVAFGFGEERSYIFSISASEDGESFTTIVSKGTNNPTSEVQYYSVAPIRARYVRITSMGRVDGGLWTQVAELEAYGYKDTLGERLLENAEEDISQWQINAMDEMTFTNYMPALGGSLYAESKTGALHLYDNVGREVVGQREIVSVKASQEPEAGKGNVAANVIDTAAASIWTASGVSDATPANITADLGDGYYVSKIGVGFGEGKNRKYTFSVALSEDGVKYTEVLRKTVAESTNDVQYYDVECAYARYVMYTFYQRQDSTAGWIQVHTVEAYGNKAPFTGAGGVMAQKALVLPNDRGDYEIGFNLNVTGNVYYSGVSIADGYITGGADLDNFTALQLRFDDDGEKFKINYMTSNYFNEGSPDNLFENSFNKNEDVRFSILVSPLDRRFYITVSDSEVTETKMLYFNFADNEKTRLTTWGWYEANTVIFNTGAGAKAEMLVDNFNLREVKRSGGLKSGSEPANGIIRLEAMRLSDYSKSSGDYYGRYVYHSGEDSQLFVAAGKNPETTRFVERRGLIGTGVSLEAAENPGYFAVVEGDSVYLRALEQTGDFYARATFYKDEAENPGYYTGSTYSYRTYLRGLNSQKTTPEDKFFYDTDNNHKSGKLGAWKKWTDAQGVFYLRSETKEYVGDNFYGNAIDSQWWTNYPWKNNNPTNDSYNFTALITYKNVIVENGELLLKATKIGDDAWPTNVSGETGKQYNGDFGRTDWKKWKGYVGVVSIRDKLFNRQCYIEGSFKQPDSPIGYWNAFWLAGRDSWPPEIDIFETLSQKYGPTAWHTAIHGEGDTNNLFGKQSDFGINVTTDYHTFALDWGYDYVKFYVDGRLYEQGYNHDTINFQKNMRLILNTGVGGWENEPDDTMVWDDGLRCKYVRCFQY